MDNPYGDQRVTFVPAPVHSGAKLKVGYNGLLKNAGADRVFVHYGYDGWKETHTMEMDHAGNGSFSVMLSASADRRIDLCFKDSADHWDNNNGRNWRCEIV